MRLLWQTLIFIIMTNFINQQMTVLVNLPIFWKISCFFHAKLVYPILKRKNPNLPMTSVSIGKLGLSYELAKIQKVFKISKLILHGGFVHKHLRYYLERLVGLHQN